MRLPTEQETAQRLRELGELYRFSMSLLEASGPLQTDAQLSRRALTITPVARAPGLEPGPGERVFVVASSARQHFVGDEYSCWFPESHPAQPTRIRAILVGVSTVSGARSDWLPPGTEGFVKLHFPDGPVELPAGRFSVGDVTLLRLRKPGADDR
ncbi:MAG: hypothetical protein Q8S33_20570 [Myxococcales bacterium]|nr:hypothetical protein [Myxococcales bacterium]MDP3502740.1 hypothetical protein [Myxococcales bacterium]